MAKLQIDGVDVANLEDELANSLLKISKASALVFDYEVVRDIQERSPDREYPIAWRAPSAIGELTILIRYYLATTDDTKPPE